MAELNASDSSTGSSGRVADRAARPQGIRGGKCPVKSPGIPPHFAQGPSSSRQTFLSNSQDVFLPTRSLGNPRGYRHLEPHGRRASSRPKSGEKPIRHARNSRGAYAREPLIPLDWQFRPGAPVSSHFSPKVPHLADQWTIASAPVSPEVLGSGMLKFFSPTLRWVWPRPGSRGRNMRSTCSGFMKPCNSPCFAQLAAFFIDLRAE